METSFVLASIGRSFRLQHPYLLSLQQSLSSAIAGKFPRTLSFWNLVINISPDHWFPFSNSSICRCMYDLFSWLWRRVRLWFKPTRQGGSSLTHWNWLLNLQALTSLLHEQPDKHRGLRKFCHELQSPWTLSWCTNFWSDCALSLKSWVACFLHRYDIRKSN